MSTPDERGGDGAADGPPEAIPNLGLDQGAVSEGSFDSPGGRGAEGIHDGGSDGPVDTTVGASGFDHGPGSDSGASDAGDVDAGADGGADAGAQARRAEAGRYDVDGGADGGADAVVSGNADGAGGNTDGGAPGVP